MFKAFIKKLPMVLFAIIGTAPKGNGQISFTWHTSSIGGGGFCLEIRFDPTGIFEHNLYLATDVSGIYYSRSLGDSWSPLGEFTPWSAKQCVPGRYITSTAFSFDGYSIIAASTEGIYRGLNDGEDWCITDMPERDELPANLKQKMIRERDGRYPRISIIREYPRDTRFMLAGIGDMRERSSAVGDSTKFGLGALLRSTNSGGSWELTEIEEADMSELVYDIDYLTDTSGGIHVFVTAGFTRQTATNTYQYKGGIYYSRDVFTAINGDSVHWVNISNNPLLTNVVSLAFLTDSTADKPIPKTSTVLAFASRCTENNTTLNPKGGIYKATMTLDDLEHNIFPNWSLIHQDVRTGRLGAKPGSTRSTFELYLGKQAGERIYLGVTNQDNDDGPASFKTIVNECLDPNAGNQCDQYNTAHDNGYREWKKVIRTVNGVPKTYWITDLKFASFDFDPEDTSPHPAVYGCWAYGPVKVEGHNGNYDDPRVFKQIFTTPKEQVQTDADGDPAYESRGMDEVFFTGCPPVFHPTNPDIVMVGCGDNGLLRSTNINGGLYGDIKWSQRRFSVLDNLYPTGNQNFVYHIAFHPLNPNLVLISAGTDNNELGNPGKGAILMNTAAGAGDENSWTLVAGGPQNLNGLDGGEMQSFVFDVKDGYKDGVFVAVRGYGIYYGKINASGNVTQNFRRIEESELLAKISRNKPNTTPPPSWDVQHSYSKLVFDPNDHDVLYLARRWPGGGVFRLRLNSARNSDDLIATNGVDEIIIGRIIGSADEITNTIRGVDPNHASDVINLLVTQTEVFAGVTCGHRADDANGKNYTGGLVQWAKTNDPGDYDWRIGGPTGTPSKTIAIGGLVQDPLNTNTILAVTYRFTLQADRNADNKYLGEDNYKLMNLWQSTDCGQTFSQLGNDITYHRWADAVTMAFFPNNPNRIIMPTHGNGIWIGTRMGGAPKATAQTDSVNTDENLPKQFALHSNYPNPFNSITLIKYDLPKATHITINIYDILGRQVRTLVDEKQKAGYHAKLWDGISDNGSRVSSGIYFYRLQTSEFTKVRKMILLQ